jgi:hypothetical protein
MQDRGFVKGEITILYNPKPLAFSIFQKPIRQVEVVGIGTHFTATLPLAERVAGWPAAAPPRPTNHFFTIANPPAADPIFPNGLCNPGCVLPGAPGFAPVPDTISAVRIRER